MTEEVHSAKWDRAYLPSPPEDSGEELVTVSAMTFDSAMLVTGLDNKEVCNALEITSFDGDDLINSDQFRTLEVTSAAKEVLVQKMEVSLTPPTPEDEASAEPDEGVEADPDKDGLSTQIIVLIIALAISLLTLPFCVVIAYVLFF